MGFNLNTLGYEGFVPHGSKVRENNEAKDATEISVADIAERPLSFDAIQEFIAAAAEKGTVEALAQGRAAQILRKEMHEAFSQGVSFRPSQDAEMRDELAEWLVGEVENLSLESALEVVSLEGLDFPPIERVETTDSIDSRQVA